MQRLKVLFLCSGNACRSQMAEGLLRYAAGDRFEASSAGTHPAGLSPHAVEALREIGIDISAHRSKPMEEPVGECFDYVITLCDQARESCPNWPASATVLHWSFDDPAAFAGSEESRKGVFRRVRNEINSRILEFVQSVR